MIVTSLIVDEELKYKELFTRTTNLWALLARNELRFKNEKHEQIKKLVHSPIN
jgi:hypothetical protein